MSTGNNGFKQFSGAENLIFLKNWQTSERPTPAIRGMLAFNTTLGVMEYFDGGTWVTSDGTVTSVGLSLPAIFSVTGSPVMGAGTLTATLVNQSANTAFMGPASGAATTPTFRTLVAPDAPPPSKVLYVNAFL